MPQNDQIWPKIGIFGQFGPGHAGLFNALLWVGWWLWRAGCISQDTYLLYNNDNEKAQKWLFLLHALPGRSKLVPPTLNLIFGLQIISFCFNVKKKNKMDKICIIFNRPILRMGRLLRMGRAYKWILECLSVRHYFEDDQSTARRLHKPL